MKELKVRITFLDVVLGTASADKEIHAAYISSKAPDAPTKEKEIEAIGVEEAIEKAMTVFPRVNSTPVFWAYQIKGFFKDACGMLRKVKDSESSKVKAYKKEIDGLIFVKEDSIPIIFDGEMGNCQRPLRGQTAQGERIALANSDSIPAGAQAEFTIQCLCDSHIKLVKEWLDYGKLRGLGQWRNSGKGRFKWEEVES